MKSTALILLAVLALSCAKKPEAQEEPVEFTDDQWDKSYAEKQEGLERVLGKMHDMVGHAIIPFDVGGSLDIYYFTNGIPGTGFATMELIKPDGTGSIPNRMGTYELVTFTKLPYDSSSQETPFNTIQGRLNMIMTNTAMYSFDAKLEPNETAEVPGDEGQPNYCLIFDSYEPNGQQFTIGDEKHGLLLIIEVFKDEMEYAMENGGAKLIAKLKAKGHYPYSDLHRESVLK